MMSQKAITSALLASLIGLGGSAIAESESSAYAGHEILVFWIGISLLIAGFVGSLALLIWPKGRGEPAVENESKNGKIVGLYIAGKGHTVSNVRAWGPDGGVHVEGENHKFSNITSCARGDNKKDGNSG